MRHFFLVLLLGSFFTSFAFGQSPGDPAVYPRTGRIDPRFVDNLTRIEEEIITFMAEEQIPGALVAFSWEGTVIMERAYGWHDKELSVPMPADALMRIASISKPFVAAALHELVQEGLLSREDYAFDLNQQPAGILPVNPPDGVGDDRLQQIRVKDLLLHNAGWDRSEAGDLTFWEIEIAAAIGVRSPPPRQEVLNYILSQPLQFTPGEDYSYSNIGYLAIGLIIEHLTGTDLMTVIHDRVLSPLGITAQDYIQGATFRQDQSSREPWYHSPDRRRNVFDPAGPQISRPYGAWSQENRVGSGGHVATATALVAFLNQRYISGPHIGQPIPPDTNTRWRWSHQGALPGTNALARQRGDGISYAVIFNKRHSYDSDESFGTGVLTRIDALLNEELRWRSGSVAVSQSAISRDQPIMVEFTGGMYATDWIGIYPPDVRPSGSPPSLAWSYVNGTRQATDTVPHGSVRFTNHQLEPGRYKVWFLARDGYTVIAGPQELIIRN